MAFFDRTRGWLGRDGYAATRVIVALVVLVLAGWTAWFFLAEIPLYEVSPRGRIEVAEAAHRIEAPVAGVVAAVSIKMGAQVKAGALLIELDGAAERLAADEQRAQLESRRAQLEPMRRELAAAQSAHASARASLPVVIAEARARSSSSSADAAFNRRQAERFAELRREGVASDFETREASARAAQSGADSRAAHLSADKVALLERGKLSQQEVEIERLRRDLAALEGDLAASEVKLRRMEHDLEQRTIRAPVGGRIGEVKTLRVGDVVEAGEHLGTLVPGGDLIMVADFDPKVLGRIQPGQPAAMRPAGFPSTQYGTLGGRVRHVASEIRDGALRVELAIEPGRGSAIPLEHGLPGVVEVEVERVSPATLVFRSVGGRLAPAASEAPREAAADGPR